MKKLISNIAVITMVTLIILPIIVFPASAIDVFGNIRTPQIETTEKIICSATIDDNFADDSVIVMLKKDANTTFKTLTQADFPEVTAKNIKCLNEYSAYIAKSVRQIKGGNVQKGRKD